MMIIYKMWLWGMLNESGIHVYYLNWTKSIKNDGVHFLLTDICHSNSTFFLQLIIFKILLIKSDVFPPMLNPILESSLNCCIHFFREIFTSTVTSNSCFRTLSFIEPPMQFIHSLTIRTSGRWWWSFIAWGVFNAGFTWSIYAHTAKSLTQK